MPHQLLKFVVGVLFDLQVNGIQCYLFGVFSSASLWKTHQVTSNAGCVFVFFANFVRTPNGLCMIPAVIIAAGPFYFSSKLCPQMAGMLFGKVLSEKYACSYTEGPYV